jgi:hypothetical protein
MGDGKARLYVHCGWQRTGTTSLQAVLARYQVELAASGVIYPARWRPGRGDAHHGLARLLRSDEDAAIREFRTYLGTRSDQTVLLSSEPFTSWVADRRRPAFLRLLHGGQEAMPVTCVWVLRSVEQVLTSGYLRMLMSGPVAESPDEYFAGGIDIIDALIAGTCELEDELGEEFAYVKYERDGAHNAEVLKRVGVPEPLRERIVEELRRMPHSNPRLTHKGMLAVNHVDEISARAGVEITHADLTALFRTGQFSFEDDEPYEIVDADVRRATHDAALRASRDHGFAPYLEFFGDLEVAPGSPASLDPALLTDRDIERLVAHLGSRELEGEPVAGPGPLL